MQTSLCLPAEIFHVVERLKLPVKPRLFPAVVAFLLLGVHTTRLPRGDKPAPPECRRGVGVTHRSSQVSLLPFFARSPNYYLLVALGAAEDTSVTNTRLVLNVLAGETELA